MSYPRDVRVLLAPILLVTTLLGDAAPGARAQGLQVGDRATAFDLPDVHGKRYTFASFRHKRILEFWYEGKQSQDQNAWLKSRLRALRAKGRLTDRNYQAVGIANYVETAVPNLIIDLALRQILKRESTLVLCDRDGRMQRLWGFRNGRSNIYLFDGQRRLLWKSSGPLTRHRGRQFLRLVQRLTR